MPVGPDDDHDDVAAKRQPVLDRCDSYHPDYAADRDLLAYPYPYSQHAADIDDDDVFVID